MTMKRLVLAALVGAALPAAANAVTTVQIYVDQAAAASNATIAQAAGLTADATVNVGAINFTDAPGNDSTTFTVGAFLNNPAGLSAAVANHILNNTYFLFTGTTFLNAGANSFVVPHDDGLELALTGLGIVLSQPGPTSPVDTPFTVVAPTKGTYGFQLAYGETAGGPAVLGFTVNDTPVGGTPEPESWALMIAGFGLVGAFQRRRVKTVAA